MLSASAVRLFAVAAFACATAVACSSDDPDDGVDAGADVAGQDTAAPGLTPSCEGVDGDLHVIRERFLAFPDSLPLPNAEVCWNGGDDQCCTTTDPAGQFELIVPRVDGAYFTVRQPEFIVDSAASVEDISRIQLFDPPFIDRVYEQAGVTRDEDAGTVFVIDLYAFGLRAGNDLIVHDGAYEDLVFLEAGQCRPGIPGDCNRGIDWRVVAGAENTTELAMAAILNTDESAADIVAGTERLGLACDGTGYQANGLLPHPRTAWTLPGFVTTLSLECPTCTAAGGCVRVCPASCR